MSNMGKTILKNTGTLMASQLITWLLTVVLMIFLPRYLGPSGMGELQIANSIWGLMNVIMSFGMDTLLVKDIARHPERIASLVFTSTVLRLLLFIVSCGLVAVYVWLQDFSTTLIVLIYLIGLTALFNQFANSVGAVLTGLEQMHVTSMATIASRVVNTVLGLLIIAFGLGIYGIGVVGILAAITVLIWQLAYLMKRYELSFQFSLRHAGLMLAGGTPYLLSHMALSAYSQVDALVIAALVNTTVLGWYSVAIQIYATLLFIPVILTNAMFPALARTHITDPTASIALMRKYTTLMLLGAIPIGLGLVAISNPLTVLMFGQAFAPSGVVLSVMGFVIIFMYMNILIGRFLISVDRQNQWSIVMLIATGATVILDLILVPWCQEQFGNGALGGSFSYLLTEMSMMCVGLILLPRGILQWGNLWATARILVAGLVMLAVCWPLRNLVIVVPVITGVIVYVGMILLLRVLPSEDLRWCFDLAQRLVARLRQRLAGVPLKGV